MSDMDGRSYGGGAEAHARSRQYGYRENSSLVLNADSRRLHDEPSGEALSLSGKVDPNLMGDRAYRGRPEAERRQNKSSRKRASSPALGLATSSKRSRRFQQEGESILSLTSKVCSYEPKTNQTMAAYDAFISCVQHLLGGQPLDIVTAAAEEILAVLKTANLKSDDKEKVIAELLNTILDKKTFDQLVSIAELITDYHQDDCLVDDHDVDVDAGVAVEFGEDEEEDGDELGQEYDLDDDDDDELEEETVGVDDSEMLVDNEKILDVQDIDAYWLQRKISQAYREQQETIDPHQIQKLAEEILQILASSSSIEGDHEVETKLFEHLQYDKFNLVKFLLRNRMKIVWCTRLARAQDQLDRNRIEEEMKMALGLDGASKILTQLHSTRATANERQALFEKSMKEEARRLKHGVSASSKDDDRSRVLDLDEIASNQHQGSKNENCELPEGSFRTGRKGYEEIHVPAPKAKPLGPNEHLVEISSMPHWAQPAFSGMKSLNRVQSRVYQTALFSADNILLCAPTGAGKTNVAMLTILKQLNSADHTSSCKIIYVAPMKALVAEVVANLSNRLSSYGVKVRELSGDQSLSRQQIDETHIIVTTPEKWDIVTRKSQDLAVKLLIIDEVHLLHDNRGPVLESIVVRTLRQIETTKEYTRLVGLSATLPNYKDVASFLRVDIERGLFHFDSSYRPIPLAQQYIGVTAMNPLKRFQMMNDICYLKVMSNVERKHQVLIFVHSRKETAKTARAIRDAAVVNNTIDKFLKEDSASREILQSHTELVKSHDLKDLLPFGFAVHHAGMVRSDRQLVEELFAEGHVQVLVSTATLAWGVNLPAHTVIIKGTQVYSPEKGAWTELSALDVMQMLGRAGRPQFDTYGEGIILTSHSELPYYMCLMNQQLPIESQMVSKLADQLNAEIVLGTVQNAKEACIWLQYTYLFIRMQRNPALYGLQAADDVKLYSGDLVHSAASLLNKSNLVKYDRKSGYFQVTDLGRVASYYYITHGTVASYNEHLKPTMSDIELCRVFTLSEEFKYVSVRQDEKVELVKLMERVPIPIKESLDEPSAKINVLLQAYVSKLKLEGLSLSSDMVFITQSAGRLMRALFEIALKRGWGQLTGKALKWCKMINKRMWGVQTPLRQFDGIPNEVLMKLEKKDLAWDRYYDLSSQEIGELIRLPKIGRTLHKLIHQFPKLNLSAAQVQPITRSVLRFEVTITPDFQWDDKVHGFVEPFWVIVEDNEGDCILHHEKFMLKKQYVDEDHFLDFTVSVYEPLAPNYFIRVVSDRWLSSQTILPVSFRHLILPEKYPPPTELLDLQPLPVTALRNPSYEALYEGFKNFNKVQTQVFSALYNSDDNVLVAAPAGSGKTICAEFAILRNYQMMSSKEDAKIMRAVYIAPVEALAKERYNNWKKKFGEGLGMTVAELTGETASDLKLLAQNQIIISTPERWDALSRRWKQQKYVQKVSLFVVDELHLIGGNSGSVLEVVMSRMRYIACQLENKIRIVALSASLANAKDLGEWIGASSNSLFNFPPYARAVPLDVHIQGFDSVNFDAGMKAMTKPTYTTIVQHAEDGKPAIVFVPTRKHTCSTAVDLMSYGNMDGRKFLLRSVEELDPFLDGVKEPILKETLRFGVAYLHEGLASSDQEIVKTLFQTGWIKVCVMCSSMCWSVPFSAHLVVIAGTQHYDSSENARTDFPVSDLLQMIGHANWPLVDSPGKCFIFCHGPRKEYYKKFLYESLPVESHLHHYLHDHLNSEVDVEVVRSKQDAVDYLTWTFMYRRLTQNPNYYNLQGVSPRHLSDHLSELVESTISDLEASKCVRVDDVILTPLNLGMIAAYYCISYTTIERFSSSLSSKTKLKGLLDVLASASEYDELPVRPGEEEMIRKLINHQRFFSENPKCSDPHVKANALLQAHFSRQTVRGNLEADQKEVLISASRLLQAMVDVISSSDFLNLSLALLAMEVSQMLTQGMWEHDSPLLQLPHFTKDLAKKCDENPRKRVETIYDLAEMENGERRELLQMSESQLKDIARFCNRVLIDLDYSIPDSDNVGAGENVRATVTLKRDAVEVGPVDAPRYPKVKEEGWWIVIGDEENNQLLAIKKVAVERKAKVTLDFKAPSKPGNKTYTLYLMSDSYLGCDQVEKFSFMIHHKLPGAAAASVEDMEDVE